MKSKLDDEMELIKEEEELVLREAPQVFVRNNTLVATVKDSEVFLIAWRKFRSYIGIVIAVILGVVLAMYYQRRLQ